MARETFDRKLKFSYETVGFGKQPLMGRKSTHMRKPPSDFATKKPLQQKRGLHLS